MHTLLYACCVHVTRVHPMCIYNDVSGRALHSHACVHVTECILCVYTMMCQAERYTVMLVCTSQSASYVYTMLCQAERYTQCVITGCMSYLRHADSA